MKDDDDDDDDRTGQESARDLFFNLFLHTVVLPTLLHARSHERSRHPPSKMSTSVIMPHPNYHQKPPPPPPL